MRKIKALKKNFNFLCLIFTVLFVIFTSGCNKDEGGPKVANAPNSACINGERGCIYGTEYNLNNYRRYGNGQYVGYYGGYSNGFCGCAPHQAVVYNDDFGLGCVNHSQLTGHAYYMYYSWNSVNFAFNSPHPRAYNPIPRQYSGSCRKDLLHACLVQEKDSCGKNNYCRAIGGGRLGICIYQ